MQQFNIELKKRSSLWLLQKPSVGIVIVIHLSNALKIEDFLHNICCGTNHTWQINYQVFLFNLHFEVYFNYKYGQSIVINSIFQVFIVMDNESIAATQQI
jgi:hypothetical protein